MNKAPWLHITPVCLSSPKAYWSSKAVESVFLFPGIFQVVPPPTLAGDLGGALGSMEHADTKFIANGRPIYAHRAVLSCQSEYFAAMFRFRCASVFALGVTVGTGHADRQITLGGFTCVGGSSRVVAWPRADTRHIQTLIILSEYAYAVNERWSVSISSRNLCLDGVLLQRTIREAVLQRTLLLDARARGGGNGCNEHATWLYND